MIVYNVLMMLYVLFVIWFIRSDWIWRVDVIIINIFNLNIGINVSFWFRGMFNLMMRGNGRIKMMRLVIREMMVFMF